MRTKTKITLSLLAVFLFTAAPAWSAGPPAPSIFDSALAISLITLMVLLLVVIGVLANMLIGAADINRKRRVEERKSGTAAGLLLIPLLLAGSSVIAQATDPAKTQTAALIGDLSAGTFYTMVAIIFLELLVVLTLLLNIRSLIRTQKEEIKANRLTEEQVKAWKKSRTSWWERFNKLKPVSQEAELDLGHEYDGIRELNNRLPPWWLYGFYATIIFAAVYLWRFHVSHKGPSSAEEYEMSVAAADKKINDYLKTKGDAVNENTVTFLAGATDLAEGKQIFTRSCAACHKETGAGDVGPNLTDDFWIHGNDIKSIFKTIRYGINAMPQWQMAYSNKQIAQVASYVKTLHGTNPPNPKAPQGTEMKEETSPPPKTDTTKTAVVKTL